MNLPQIYIDLLCAAHLLCFATGMGTALFFDVRTLWSLNTPIRTHDIKQLEHIHLWITGAFGGLWVTGVMLIYVRTGFDLANFPPKLWVKIAIMVLMTVNAGLIGIYVLPLMRNTLGRALSDVPKLRFATTTQIAAISMFCWTSGLMLGSSVTLKTTPFEVLEPLALAWFVGVSLCCHLVMFARCRHASGAVPQSG